MFTRPAFSTLSLMLLVFIIGAAPTIAVGTRAVDTHGEPMGHLGGPSKTLTVREDSTYFDIASGPMAQNVADLYQADDLFVYRQYVPVLIPQG
jgi:hypothetical protein